MIEYNLKACVTELASANCDDGTENVNLMKVVFPWMAADNCVLSTRSYYVVSHHLMDYDEYCWDRVFPDMRSAVAAFGKEANHRYGKNGEGEKKYGRVEWTEDWPYYRDELLPDEYVPASASSGDYGPGNPWDAPGMKVSDFISGVY